MIPKNKKEFAEWCLRELGAPVLKINVDEDQVDDRIDYALKKYADYHFDATEKIYFKHQLELRDWPDAVHHVNVVSGGTGYVNGNALVFTNVVTKEVTNPVGTVTTDDDGVITGTTLTAWGKGWSIAPSVSVTSGAGLGASLNSELGGYIEIPENIIGVVSIFDLSSTLISQDMFSIQYQIALNDLWSLSTYSMVPYYLTMSHLSLIQQLLLGSPPIRYTRHRNRMYIDISWARVVVGNYIIATCYQAISPNEFPDIWGDIWLQRYAAALIKKQWGNNMKKYGNMALPEGTVMNGQQIYNEAVEEITKLEYSLINDFSIPLEYFMG